MKPVWILILAICAVMASGFAAAAATLPVGWVENAPDGRLKAWHATLDLRELPAKTRPASIRVTIDASKAVRSGAAARVAISLNGLVIGRAWAKWNRPTTLDLTIEDRLLSTRNHLAVSVTTATRRCGAGACSVASAELRGTPHIGLEPANAMPMMFAHYVTRFREGLAIRADGAENRALAEIGVAALAPHAPRRAAGPAEVVVSRTTPRGIAPALRFDTGPVEIRDRDGSLVYDEGELNRLTIIQAAMRGETPVLWIRPGTDARPVGPIELDYGSVALFGREGREIAFSPDQDQAAVIAYASDAAREARVGLYWRLAVLAVWLVITGGLIWIIRRMPPLQQPLHLQPGEA